MTDSKISKNREKKQNIVSELSDKVSRSKALVFADYKGMTHKQLEDLKKSLKKAEAEMVVAKNTLVKRSLENSVFKVQNAELNGPTITLFAYNDVIAPLRELAKSIKNLKLPVIKFGILDNQVLTGDQVLRLSTLPSREVLIAQVVAGFKSPIFGLHRTLSWNLQKLVITLKAIESKKV